MSDRHPRPDGDPHERFHAWLVSGASGDPARDAALHASVCPDCQREIGAFDALTEIAAGRAPLPPSRVRTVRSAWLRGARVAGAASGVAALAIVAGVGLGSALQLPQSPAAVASGSTVQDVLGGRSSPLLTDRPTPQASATAVMTPPPTTSPTASPTPSPSPAP